MVLNTIPVFGVVAAICVLRERITWVQGVAAAVILIAFCFFEEGAEEPEPMPAESVQPDTAELAEHVISRAPVLGATTTGENPGWRAAEA